MLQSKDVRISRVIRGMRLGDSGTKERGRSRDLVPIAEPKQTSPGQRRHTLAASGQGLGLAPRGMNQILWQTWVNMTRNT
ncbi:uncharacterized protein N7482_003883 [Penicillium canariense]|uniref:Uncharacterized protein n=1 Tax=Penicillium canariense TaxID=189055 RepID=A0A9W9I7T9_9EURO|nr:uncharacterized protein N7482_003883 [Penicillium canariense]KAJ5168289.1 hypothetical protein N7482_003883 [Penicillium canariense]